MFKPLSTSHNVPEVSSGILTRRAEQQESLAKELLPLLRRFTLRWEQDIVLGDRRWQCENMKNLQRFAKGLLRDILKIGSTYSDSWNQVENQIQLLSTELRQLVAPELRHMHLQDLQLAVTHGGKAYDMIRGFSRNVSNCGENQSETEMKMRDRWVDDGGSIME